MFEPVTEKIDLKSFLTPKKEYKKEIAKKQYFTHHGKGFFSLTYHKIPAGKIIN